MRAFLTTKGRHAFSTEFFGSIRRFVFTTSIIVIAWTVAAQDPGDANGDGLINAADVDAAVDHILEVQSAAGEADCNGDGRVDVLDLVCILNRVMQAPIADAGADLTVMSEDLVRLNGSRTVDPDGDPIQFQWRFIQRPARSEATLSGAATATPSFKADRPGTFLVELTARDATGAGTRDTVSINVTVPPPSVIGFTPVTAPKGTLITVTGRNFAPVAGIQGSVRVARQGGGTIIAPVVNASNTELNFGIPAGAATGVFSVVIGNQSAPAPGPLTIVSSVDFTLSAMPASADVIQGKATTYAVRLNSANGFAQLADLTIDGLPDGVTAEFRPARITGGQTSILTVQTPEGQSPGGLTLTIDARSVAEGLELQDSARVRLNVMPLTTTLLGRTVTTDALQTPLAGVTVTMLGMDDQGNATGCSGQTVSDEAGNFVLTDLSPDCAGLQLIRFDGSTVTAPQGDYAGVDLAFTLEAGAVTESPVLIHLPRVDNRETVMVKQNAAEDQHFDFRTIANLSVTVPAGTVFTLPDGGKPDPFRLTAVQVPIDRLPDEMPQEEGISQPFIVAFQPANTHASKPVAVFFPNLTNVNPGVRMDLSTLDPTKGVMVVYGTGMVSGDGRQIVPDMDPAFPGLRFGLVNFDWHGPRPGQNDNPGGENGGAGPPGGCRGFGRGLGSLGSGGGLGGASFGGGGGFGRGAGGSTGGGGFGGGNGGFPGVPDGGGFGAGGPQVGSVDLGSGQFWFGQLDFVLRGRCPLVVRRIYRSKFNLIGAFGYGFKLDLEYRLVRLSNTAINLVDPEGRRFRFSRAADGSFVDLTDPILLGARLIPADNGTFSLRFKQGTLYRFNEADCLMEIRRRTGCRILIERNPQNEIEALSDATGLEDGQPVQPATRPRRIEFEYDSIGNRRVITSARAPDGRRILYRYESVAGQTVLSSVVNPADGVTRYIFERVGVQPSIVSILNPRGIEAMRIIYDTNGRVGQQVLPNGGVYSMNYTVNGGVLTRTQVRDPSGASIACRFNAMGLPLQRMNRGDQPQILERQSGSNLVTATTDALGRRTEVKYDANGNVTEAIAADGRRTTYTYDPTFNQLTSVRDDQGKTIAYQYDAQGNLVTITDALGKTFNLEYNAFGQLTRITNERRETTRFEYDAAGNLIRMADRRGNTSAFDYDSAFRLIQVTGPEGRTTRFEYDALDRVTGSTDAQGNRLAVEYDANGNDTAATDENGNTTRFAYDSSDRLIRITDPLGRHRTLTFDAAGKVMERRDRFSHVATYEYDGSQRLSAVHYSDGSTTTYQYDAVGNLLEARDSVGGTVQLTYDRLNRIVRQITPSGTIDYRYDSLGRRSEMTVLGREPVTYDYDAMDRLTAIRRGAESVMLEYDVHGRVLTVERANGVKSIFDYNPDGQVTAIQHRRDTALISRMTYTYDRAGLRTGFTTDNGQPLAIDPVAMTFGPANRLLSNDPFRALNDAEGNLSAETGPGGTTRYTWDARNRLTRIEAPGMTAEFVYDAFNRRISKIINGNRTDYLYDFANVVQELREGSAAADYLTGLDLDSVFCRTDRDGPQYLLRDALGSVTLLTDGDGRVSARYFYDPFGRTTAAGGADNPYRFAGREQDETGLYYLRTRYYHPGTRRFLSEDTIGFFGGDANLYAYVGNDPVNRTDPNGEILGAVIVVGVAFAIVTVAGLKAFQDNAQVALKRPVTPGEIKAFQSPESRRRRARALAGLNATASVIGIAGLLGPSPNVISASGVGLAEGVPDLVETAGGR